MTNEEKQLLLKDICARLPYGVKFTLSGDNIYTIKGIDLIVTDDGDWEYAVTAKGIDPIEIEYIKPYLRPMSSMNENKENEWDKLMSGPLLERIDKHTKLKDLMLLAKAQYEPTDWLLERHFDFRGLIEMGLALEAPDGMYENF